MNIIDEIPVNFKDKFYNYRRRKLMCDVLFLYNKEIYL